MNLTAEVDGLNFPHENWWQDTAHVRRVLEAAEEVELTSRLDYFAVKRGPKRRDWPLEQLPEKMKEWRTDFNAIFFADPKRAYDWQLSLTSRSRYLGIAFYLGGDLLRPHQQDIIPRLSRFMIGLHQRLAPDVLCGPSMIVRVSDLEYPRVRPPPVLRFLQPDVIFEAFSFKFMREAPRDIAGAVGVGLTPGTEVTKKLVATPVPRGVQRENQDGLAVFTWADSLEDEAYVASQMSLREQWLARQMQFETTDEYNSLGDRRIIPRVTRNPHVSFYDASEGTAYAVLPVFADGSVDEQPLAALAGWRKAGALPDGAEVKLAYVLVQSRDAAMKIMNGARSRGIDGVCYVAEDGATWWDPHPPGSWVEKPDPRLDDLVPPPKPPSN